MPDLDGHPVVQMIEPLRRRLSELERDVPAAH
jgi:hypothetical protein